MNWLDGELKIRALRLKFTLDEETDKLSLLREGEGYNIQQYLQRYKDALDVLFDEAKKEIPTFFEDMDNCILPHPTKYKLLDFFLKWFGD